MIEAMLQTIKRALQGAAAALFYVAQPLERIRAPRARTLWQEAAPASYLARAALDQQRTAVVLSLWPELKPAGQCAIGARYLLSEGQADFGWVLRMGEEPALAATAATGARALLAQLGEAGFEASDQPLPAGQAVAASARAAA